MNIFKFKNIAEYTKAKSILTEDSISYVESTGQVFYGAPQENEESKAHSFFVTCKTEEDESAKEVTVQDFALSAGIIISVLFKKGFTVSNPTLNVSGTGAKPINYLSEPIEISKVVDNTLLTMIYDGENYNVVKFEHQEVQPYGLVDLGLPSGRLWADRNLGANSPSESGLYYSWGNTDGHTADEVEDGEYEFSGTYSNGAWTGGTYASTKGATLTGNINAGAAFDAARKNLGYPWRLPTKEDFQKLHDECTWTWTQRNGVNGYEVTGRNGNSIFFPAAGCCYDGSVDERVSNGYYWSSSVGSGDYAFILYFDSGNVYPQDINSRRCGFPVRAVQ